MVRLMMFLIENVSRGFAFKRAGRRVTRRCKARNEAYSVVINQKGDDLL